MATVVAERFEGISNSAPTDLPQQAAAGLNSLAKGCSHRALCTIYAAGKIQAARRPGLSRLPVLLGTGVVSRLQVLLGTGVITDTLLDLKLKVSPSSFFQVLQ